MGNSLPGVNITYENGNLGLVQSTDDGAAAIIIACETWGTAAIGTPILFNGTAKLKALGISAGSPIDTVVRHFYATAGDGASLYVIIAGARLDDTNPTPFPIIDGADLMSKLPKSVRLLGWQPWLNGRGANSPAKGHLLDMVASANHASEQARDQRAWPFIVLMGLPFADTADNLPDLRTLSCNRVAVCAESFADYTHVGDIGYAIGRLAAETVQRNLGRVKSGPITMQDVYFNETLMNENSLNETAKVLNQKGYLCFRTHVGKAGNYFVDDPTATAQTDDYSSIARVRVIDKAAYLTRAIYTNEILDDFETAPDGTLDPGYAKGLEKEIEKQVGASMLDEITSISCYVDPNQNVISTETTNIVIGVQPRGYQKQINVSLGLRNPQNS